MEKVLEAGCHGRRFLVLRHRYLSLNSIASYQIDQPYPKTSRIFGTLYQHATDSI